MIKVHHARREFLMAVYTRIAFQLYNFLVYCVVALFCYAIVLGVLLCSLHRALLAVMLVLPELLIRFVPVTFAASLQVPSKLKWRDRFLGPSVARMLSLV